MTARGVRNCNPGNIRRGADWQGMADVQGDGDFVTFKDPVWGIRALAITLVNYDRKHGLDTVEGIISRWAPPVENLTGAYQADVAARLGVGLRDRLTVRSLATLEGLCAAIIHHENAGYAYPEAVLAQGVALALEATA